LPDDGRTGTFSGFGRAVIIEMAGASDEVRRLLSPLVSEEEVLREGLRRVGQALGSVVEKRRVH